MPSRRAPIVWWLPYVSAIVVATSFGWAMLSGWFALVNRVNLLEQEQRYSHGDLRPFLKEP